MAALRLQTRQVILLEIICSCGFSDKYIRGMRLVCRNDNSAGQVIFLARIISFDGMTALIFTFTIATMGTDKTINNSQWSSDDSLW